MYEIGAKDIIEKILPVVDNFERGLGSVPEEEKNAPFVEGMEKIYKQLMTTLESVGVKPIEAVGQEFNPDFHNAVMHVEDEGLGENIIAEEFQKGYMYRESVVRHSMVKMCIRDRGIGMALYEDVVYNEKGKNFSNSLMQYKIPTRLDVGTIRVEFESSYEPTGPFGAKSIGEIVINTPSPAISNAIQNATGVIIRELPMTAEKIYRGISGR